MRSISEVACDYTTYLKAGMEAAVFKVIRACSEGVHKVTTHSGVALGFSRENRTDVCEDTVEHIRNPLNSRFENVEISCRMRGWGGRA